MKSKTIWLILSCLLVLSMVLASCGTKTTPTTTPTTTSTSVATTKPTTTPTTSATTAPTTTAGKPQYGGTFTYRMNSDIGFFDPHLGGNNAQKLWLEILAMMDWTVDRNLWDFKVAYAPIQYETGRLAESWETTDMQTLTFHIRKGVRWQNIPPVNGREMTASDLEYTFQRQLGLGSGFTKPSPYVNMASYAFIKSVTATDKYTLVIKLSEPNFVQFSYLLGENHYMNMVAPEVVKQYGDAQDWRHAIGTGPFILEDFVSGSSLTAIRNDDYWMYDPLYPQNRLPYLDQVKVLIIPDEATAIAGFRTGKIDLIENLPWQQAASLKGTIPQLLQASRPQNSWVIHYHVDQKPFNDIRVRKAMQMAIDIPTIARTFYGGNAVSTPTGLIGIKDYYTPFDQWPADVKAGYTYNPEGAKKLLAEAGYPNGFKCTLTASAIDDLDLYQVVKSYLASIGVNMEIQVMEPTVWTSYTRADKQEMMTGQFGTFAAWPPEISINHRYSQQYSFRHHIQDATYDGMWLKTKTCLDAVEQQKLIIQMDAYATAQQWTVTLPPFYNFVVWQPWLKSFNGETSIGGIFTMAHQLWINQDMKKASGH
jgi:peptide/nickel transport system substrate-binding protein